MFRDGLVAEAQSLRERFGDGREITALHSLGYRQALEHLRAELSLDRAIAAAQQGHRNYAKRQMTWFRREPDVLWLEGFGDNPATRRRAIAMVSDLLDGLSTS
jgi:tRNA dimethylallyltransferase